MTAESGLVVGADGQARCWWGAEPALYRHYHDTEWGRPVADDVRLFEKMCLEGFQAGLSWLTILKKREAFRTAFHGFDPEKLARFDEADIARLLADPGIVRHRGKIEAAIGNARLVLDLQDAVGSLAAFLWRYEPAERTAPLGYDALRQITESPESRALARDLKRRGWRFFGPTTAYAFFQAMGLVNDHVPGCSRYQACQQARAAFSRPL